MVIYDFVVGERLSKNYIKNRFTDRFDNKKRIASLPELVAITYNELKKAFIDMNDVPDAVDTVMHAMSDLNDAANKGVDEKNYHKYRELLSILAFNGFEVYIIERVDLQTIEIKPGSRAYMIDKNDELFPMISRASSGYGLVFENQADCNEPEVVMSFLNSVLNFDSVTEQLVNINNYKAKFDALKKVHAGWTLNINDLLDFLDDYGYKFIISIDA